MGKVKRTDGFKKVQKYRINGRLYNFYISDSELFEETPLAYCYALHKWAWLYPECVYFKGENMVKAEKIF